jgi:formylglycine-generating enzyme required for sulfatase activity
VAVIGAQRRHPHLPRYDVNATENEAPPHEVDLDPYFLSKYELTKGQWLLATGKKTGKYLAGEAYKAFGPSPSGSSLMTSIHPADQISWEDAYRVLGRMGLNLPSEAQWEHAARGGVDSIYWTGDSIGSLAGQANVADRSLGTDFLGDPGEFLDGYPYQAPVNALGRNRFGLYGIGGNVREWCLDWLASTYDDARVVPGIGEHVPAIHLERVVRDGSFLSPLLDCRLTSRHGRAGDSPDDYLGTRPARVLETF